MILSSWEKIKINGKILAILSLNFCLYIWFTWKGFGNHTVNYGLDAIFLSRVILLYHIFLIYLAIIVFYPYLTPTLKRVVWALILLNCSHNIGCLTYPFPRTQVLKSESLIYLEPNTFKKIRISIDFKSFPQEFHKYLQMALEGKKKFFIRQFAVSADGLMQVKIGKFLFDHSGINISPIYLSKKEIEEFLKIKKIEFICTNLKNSLFITARELGFKPDYRIDQIFVDETHGYFLNNDGIFSVAWMFANDDNTPDKMFY